MFQVSRPITLKKDGIQTRNRKLAAKAKKRRHGLMSDFLRPLDSHTFSAYQQAMGSMGSTGYLGNSMSQYYASNFGPATSMTSQFAGMGYHHPHHHPGSMAAGTAGSAFSFGSSPHMSGMPGSLVAGAMA